MIAQGVNEGSLQIVTRLSDEYEKTGNILALSSLTNLIRNDRVGPNAAGALKLLARKVTPKQAQSMIVPALIEGLTLTNAATQREVAIALREYSSYVAPFVPTLLSYLNSGQEIDKRGADIFVVQTLGRIGPKSSSAMPMLLKILDWPEVDIDGYFEDPSPRIEAAVAIGRIGFTDSTTRLRLEKALDDKNPYVRVRSAIALIDNRCTSEHALATLSTAMATNNVRFVLKPATLQLIHNAATNINPPIQEAAQTLLNKLKSKVNNQ